LNVSSEQPGNTIPASANIEEPAKPVKSPLQMTAKYTRKILKRLLVLAVVGFFAPSVAILYLVTGIYDVVRHGRDLAATFHQYFLINGALTWIFSPLNTLIDIISLPFVNKKIYTLSDFPVAYQEEIRAVTERCPAAEIVAEVNRRRQADDRSMLIYKWYGFNNPAADSALFQQDFKYILTVGVSTFRKQTKTDRHFGWLRAGVRVLYNIDPATDDGAYIVVNGTQHTWSQDGPLFIFDDTILHQSFNLTDQDRHCLFIDVVRPSYFPGLIRGFVKLLGLISSRLPFLSSSSNWRLI
jgi:hypothetical protein